MAYSSEGRKTAHTVETPRGKVSIPDKLYFKIGEVCEIVGVEPHVLRYWEQEFPQLAPQKSSAGQRIYRRKDVEIALRIKSLREDEGFTIAGAKKRLSAERSASSRFKVVSIERPADPSPAASLSVTQPVESSLVETTTETPAELSPADASQVDKALATLHQVRAGLES
ncbi:MAG: MerR family transcriptional regulator, partial [Chloracidobacterium sp.]